MTQTRTGRQSDSPYIDRVWYTISHTDGTYLATPDASWDLIVCTDADGNKQMLLTGQATKSDYIPYTAGSSAMAISFSPAAYMPHLPSAQMVNLGEMLPNADSNHFILAGRTFEIPSFEQAEKLVEAMVKAGVLKLDEVIASSMNGQPKAMSERSKQRHFKKTTGMTPTAISQIQRAQEAVRQLQAGKKPLDVAAETGYVDQSHLTKSLKKLMDSKPSDVSDIHKL